jgi:hypothetical protein
MAQVKGKRKTEGSQEGNDFLKKHEMTEKTKA